MERDSAILGGMRCRDAMSLLQWLSLFLPQTKKQRNVLSWIVFLYNLDIIKISLFMTDFYVGRIQETDIILKISKGLWK